MPNVCLEKNPADTRKKSKHVANAILLSTDQKHTSVNLNAADPFRGISFTALSESFIFASCGMETSCDHGMSCSGSGLIPGAHFYSNKLSKPKGA